MPTLPPLSAGVAFSRAATRSRKPTLDTQAAVSVAESVPMPISAS
jgi:hypothetical protein